MPSQVMSMLLYVIPCALAYYVGYKMKILYTVYGSSQLLLVLLFTYFVIALQGAKKMIDVMSEKMFHSINKNNSHKEAGKESLASLSTLRRFNQDVNSRKSIRDHEKKANELWDIKENSAVLNISKRRPVMGLSCLNCNPTNYDSLANHASREFALKNILNYTPAQSKFNFLHRTFNHLSQVYELKKFDYPQVEGTILHDDRIRKAVVEASIHQFRDSDSNDDDYYQELLKINERRARKLLHDMRSTLSDFLLRFTSWVLYKLLPCFLTSVVVHPSHVEMLKNVGERNLPLIFLPLHRSHLDYILMSFILLNNNVRSPLVAAGDNLRIPFFGSLLRGLGAFFIRRRVDPIMGRKDHVYKALLHTYMNECLRAGHNIEFFLEGGRTRTGKPCLPKYGIFSVIVEAFMDNTIEDALLVPVSINYEKLVDGNFIREQLGQPKEMETFGSAIKGIWHVLNSNYGMMRIDFNQPFSLRELVKTFSATGRVKSKGILRSNPSTTSLYGTDVISDEHKSLVESISKHIIFDCANTQAIMSTNAVAFILLTRFREGTDMETLVKAIDNLKDDLYSRKRDVGFSGESLDVINYVIELFGPALIRKEKVNNVEIVKPVSLLPNVIELAYYSNALLTCYALESAVALAINSFGLSAGQKISQDSLVDACMEVFDILQYEFIFCKPCQNLEALVLNCLADLIDNYDIFLRDEHFMDSKYIRIADELEDNDRAPVTEEYTFTENGFEHLAYLRGVLGPIMECYSATAFSLDKLISRSLLENEFVNGIITDMQQSIKCGQIRYEESISVDSIKNALRVYQKWDVLECHTEKKIRLYYLKDSQDNKESVRILHNRVNKYR